MSSNYFNHMTDGKLLMTFASVIKQNGASVNDPIIRSYMDELIARNLAEEMAIVMGTNR